ncbi:E3 ubiquitin-protein ligase RNF128-like isoform X1 [Conger conger]|uniref:E3 ubiquitin-protein ligase RNF128-like isoform X1 n=1 Tax=Conger conger TaxID=82655 RepID=UPI002A599319|nr:E3 ubiquitin-protein ligase RNF128-like isoform X1 [Conger conger]
MAMEGRRGFSWLWACLWILLAVQHGAMASVFWTAYVAIKYKSPTDNQTVRRMCECGVYGYNSLIGLVQAPLELPVQDPLACDPMTTFTNSDDGPISVHFLALIKRGNCTFTEKDRIATSRGAIGVVIYNLDGTGNETSPMYLEGTRDTVAIMIGNSWGMEIVKLIKSGVRVSMEITVGNPHGPWMSQYSLILVSLSFFVVTAVTVGYFIFHSARRLYSARAHIRRQKQLKDEAKKAIGQLQVRTLQHGDQETGPEADTCAVCIDAYKPGDVVSILTCSHFFHKTCIEPWLLEHRTCPMCKCDILKSLGIELEGGEEPEDHGNGLQVSVVPDSQTLPTATSGIEIDRRSETASSGYASVHESEGLPSGAQTPSNMPHQNRHNPTDDEGVQVGGSPVYDNLAFEGDTQSPLEVKS